MDLIVWRHAEARDATQGEHDLERPLTRHGKKQAAAIARWLNLWLPENIRTLCSPALRCEQTVFALGREYKLRDELAPGYPAQRLLDAAGWPNARLPVLVVGHQPTLGQVIAKLLALKGENCSVRKGAVWWLRGRQRDGHLQTSLVAVQPPELA